MSTSESACDSTLQCLLGEAFDGLREGVRANVSREEYERMKNDFIFRMTDWQEDLESLHSLLSSPEEWKGDAASDFLVGFLYHVAPHVNAAKNLLLDDD